MKKIYDQNTIFKDFNESDLNSYDGVNKSVGYFQNREYLNIEPNISVRAPFDRRDYEAFRPGEANPEQQKKIMSQCMRAYEDVGIIRNIIDLMSDFSSQGMNIVHKDPKIQNFYRNFYKKVDGDNVTERFLNYLYRVGNVIFHRTTAKITKKQEGEFKKSCAEPISTDIQIYRREIPWSYEFLNPLKVNIKSLNGEKQYTINVNDKYFSNGTLVTSNVDNLPQYILDQVKTGKKEAVLDKEKIGIYYYKKDDWLLWANPMIHPILDDITMLQKMRMADIAALDGAISNIRLWTIGDLEHKIIPREPVINKLRNIIASNVGGGTFDLIWGPDLKFQESNTQVYKFLGEEKYKPVLNSIYQGLGISAAITGSSGNASYTNNYVSIKVLIERLEYGRKAVINFWNNEFEMVRRAMKFEEAARIHFDAIVLSDEASMRKVLIDLVDRNLISEETLLERFKEDPEIEKERVKREHRFRKKSKESYPRKTSPFHAPNHKEDIAKLAVQSQMLGKEYFEELELPYQKPPMPPKGVPSKTGNSPARVPKKSNNGRPKSSKDVVKRKTKIVRPKSKGMDTSLFLWALSAQEKINDIVTPIFLSISERKNVRSLTEEEFTLLEELRLTSFLGHKPYQEINEESVNNIIKSKILPSKDFIAIASEKIDNFIKTNHRKPNISEIRTIYAIIFSENI